MNLLAHEIRFDLLDLARNKRARIMTLVFPLVLLVILAGISKGGTTTIAGSRVTLQRFFVGGIMAMSLVTACYGSLVSVLVAERESGVLKRRRAAPVPAWVVVAGRAITGLAVALGSALLLLVAARVLYGVGLPASGIGEMVLAVVLGGLALTGVAYAVASLVSDVEGAQPVVQLTMLPLWFISGIWFSTDELPTGLQHVAQALPVEPLAHLLHLATLQPRIDGTDVAVLAAWAVGGAFVAARRFDWLPRRR
jgi:ABC-2 type transport system permease protein